MAIFVHYQGTNQGSLFGNRASQSPNNRVSVTDENGGLKVLTPYSASFIETLKNAVPSVSRKWHPTSRCWLVSPSYSSVLKQIIDSEYDCDVTMPTVISPAIPSQEIRFQADYVANCKNEAASVHSNGGWNAKIPEKILRSWFKQTDSTAPATLYGVLGVENTASNIEIKKAYRRAARQWHPDICREENARDMFEKVKDAYQLLNDRSSRKKYNAGLVFEQMAKKNVRAIQRLSRYSTFTPTLRCGILTVKAKQELGVLIVEEIFKWDDIINETGQTMVSFWAQDNFSVAWI